MALTEEELSKLTPEQILELQKQQCIFCQIISGKVQTRRIYEDDKVLAILDINPANPGHILLLPKEHYAILPQMPDELIAYIFMVAKHLSHALIIAFKVKGTTIYVANGAVAGQRAPHFMIHIIPRTPDDGIKAFAIPSTQMSEQDLNEIQKILVQKINEVFGIKSKEQIKLDKTPEKIEAKGKEFEGEKPKKEPEKPQKEKIQSMPEKSKGQVDLDKVSETLFRQLGGK